MPLSPATSADLDAIVSLVNGAYRGEEAKKGWATEAGYIEGPRVHRPCLEADLADSTIHLLVLRDEAALDGLLGCVRLEERGEGVWFLGMLSVRPALQAKGTGRIVLEGAEAYARERGARRMRMGVISIRDTLIAWYERRGYADTGERAPYSYGGALRDDLEFATLERAL